MQDERSNGNGGAGASGDEVDDFSEPEEPTVVISSEVFLRDALVRLGDGVCRVGDDLSGLGGLVEQLGAAAVLPEAADRIVEVMAMLGGALRAVRRLEQIERKKETP